MLERGTNVEHFASCEVDAKNGHIRDAEGASRNNCRLAPRPSPPPRWGRGSNQELTSDANPRIACSDAIFLDLPQPAPGQSLLKMDAMCDATMRATCALRWAARRGIRGGWTEHRRCSYRPNPALACP